LKDGKLLKRDGSACYKYFQPTPSPHSSST
jgi:hypothetical protein